MAEISIINYQSGGGGGGAATVETQDTTVLAGNTVITVTMNGGVLPTSDDAIRVATATGPLFQGAGAGEYSISRAGVPNTITLVTAPLADLRFLIQGIF